MVLGNDGPQNRLYVNDGTGTFSDATASQMPVDVDYTHSVALGDVDGDGDLDVVIGNHAPQNRLYVNDGTGTFSDVTATRMPVNVDYTQSVALGDVDGDGDLDMVIGNWGQQNRLYANDGTGTFTGATAPHMPAGFYLTRSVALGDVDGDGDLDIVVGNSGQNRLYLNNGTGTFSDVTASRMPVANQYTNSIALGDVDGDGDLDLVCGYQYLAPKNDLYFNLNRQLHAPTAPQIGQPYTLDAYMRYGTSTVANFALPYLSTAPASIAVPPFGTLGIDLTMAAPFAPLMVPQPIGVSGASFFVPNEPSLVGQAIYSQAMLIGYAFDLRLSNVVADLIQ
jgi:predicted nucleotidyltransferase